MIAANLNLYMTTPAVYKKLSRFFPCCLEEVRHHVVKGPIEKPKWPVSAERL